MTKTKLAKLFIAVLAVAFILSGIIPILPCKTRTQPTSASQGAIFDHSNCQYPDRWSNPADGCDNSDPAVPECIKAMATQAGEQACIAEFVKQHEQQTNVSNPNIPATLELKQSNNTCGNN